MKEEARRCIKIEFRREWVSVMNERAKVCIERNLYRVEL